MAFDKNISRDSFSSMEQELERHIRDLEEGKDVFASREELGSRPETVRKRIETENSGNPNSISINGVYTGEVFIAEQRPINLSVFDPTPTGSPLLQQQDQHSVMSGYVTPRTSSNTLSQQCSACDRTFTGKFSRRHLQRHFEIKHSEANLLQLALEDLDHEVKRVSSAQENSSREAAKHKRGHQMQQASAQTLEFASTETELVRNSSQNGSDGEEQQKLSASHGSPVHHGLEDTRSILERLTARNDISEDFWDSLGLTRSSIESIERVQGRSLSNGITARSAKSEKKQSFTANPPWSEVNLRKFLTSSKDIGTMPDPRPQTMSVTENPHAASTSTVSQPPYQGATSDSVPKFPDHMNPAHTPTRLSKLVEETKLLPVTTEIEEDEQDEFDENKGVAQPTTNQLPDPPPIYPPPRPERLTMELPKPPVAHEDVIVNGHSISDEEMGFADGVLDAHSALRYRRVDGTQRQRDLPSSEKLSTTNQPIYLGRDGEEPARVKAQSEDAEALRVDGVRQKSSYRVSEYYWTCCQCSTNRLPDDGQGCAECGHRICDDCDIDDRNRPHTIMRRGYYDVKISSWRKDGSDLTSKRSPDKLHLLTWFNAHRDDPYPDATEKVALAKAAQLTVNGVNNWFINARRRYRTRELRYTKDAARSDVREQPGTTSTGSGTSSSDTATTNLKRCRPYMENDEVWPRWTIVGTTIEQQLETYLSEHGLPQDVCLCPMRVDGEVTWYYLLIYCEERSHFSVRHFFAQPSIVKLLEVGTNGQEVQIHPMRSVMSQKFEALIARRKASTELSIFDDGYSRIGITSAKYEGEAHPIIEAHHLEAVPDAVRDDSIRYEGYEEILQPPAQEPRRTGKEQSSTELRSSTYEFDGIDEQLRGILDWLEPRGTYFSGEDTLVKLLRTFRTALVELGRLQLNTVSAENTQRIVVALAEFHKELTAIHGHLLQQASLFMRPAGLWQDLDGLGVDMHQLQYDLETTIDIVNAFVQQRGSELFATTPWDWSIWRRKIAHPPVTVPYPTALSDDESDGASVASLVDSIFSEASLHSTATGLSVASGYSAAQIETATRELLHIFLEDQSLACLYAVAIERVDIGPARLQRNIGRLMKAFARDLLSEAEQELQRLAARLVSAKRSYVAQAIIERYEVRPSLEPASHAQSPPKIHHREDSSDEEGEEAEEEKIEEAVDEDLIEDLLAFRQFLAAGEAFAKFRSKLEAFVLPKSIETRTETIAKDFPSGQETTSSSGTGISMRAPDGTAEQEVPPTVFAKIRKTTAQLLSAVGLLEPPLDCGWVRLRWQCRCGQQFFGDVKEYRADGVKELIEKMSRSTGAKVTVVPYNKTSNNQHWILKAPSWLQKLTRSSNTGQKRGLGSTGCLPQHNTPNQSSLSTSSTLAPSPTAPTKPKLHLLACTHRTQRQKCLLQDPIDGVSTDRALFCFMKQQLQHSRSRIRSILSMRSVQGIFFVKFRLRMSNTVEVRDHNPCCVSSNANTCECIPPVPKVEPSPTAEYRCTPAGPLAIWPPVLSQDLMHMLSSPQCINEQETWVLDQLPKRTVGELQACAGQPAEGWGIYYQEGIDFDMIIGVVFVVFILASLLFAILWTRLEMDIQGAFGVSSYMVTASGIFLAWMASRAKNFG